jgi:nucleoside-diphosphate-sugar epimerase
LTLNPDPFKVIPLVLSGVKNTLTAAARTPSVKRFVYTSSSAAATAPIANKKFHIDASTWNDADVEAAWAPPPYTGHERRLAVYAASKTLAEKECWRFMQEEKPAFVLNTVLPNCNIGRILSKEQPASTGGWYKGMWEGDAEMLKLLHQFPPQHWVNVTDTALLHLAALLEEDVVGERLLAFAGPFNFNDTADLIEKLDADGYGDGSRRYERIKDCPKDLKTVDTERAQDLLRRYGRPGFTDLETSLKEAITS